MRVLFLGSDGFLGNNLSPELKRWLSTSGHGDAFVTTRKDCDLQRLDEVTAFFKDVEPHTIVHLAGRVGGFLANKTKPADIGLVNLQIGINVLIAAREAGVKRIINFVGSCSYPRNITSGIKETDLAEGYPDPTSAAYAIGKTALHENLMAMSKQYGMDNLTLLPANVYGPFDHFDPDDGHVVPALIYKLHHAALEEKPFIDMIGSGNAERDFLFAPDLLLPLKHILSSEKSDTFPRLLNVGTGSATSIRELASVIGDVVGYEGELRWENSSDNDGQNVKYLDCALLDSLGIGFQPTSLRDGIEATYEAFLQERSSHDGY